MLEAGLGGTSRLPVHLLTGFLGSGKTTLLNRVLRATGMDGALVIVNEFGEVGLDHLLIETPADETVLLANGCLCCSVLGDLQVTMTRLIERRDAGEIRPFTRILIETTGLANPTPILRTLAIDPFLSRRLTLAGVVTLVDGCNGLATLTAHPEAVRQVAVADQLVLSKTDLASCEAITDLTERLRAINVGARLTVNTIADERLADLFAATERPLDLPYAETGHRNHDNDHGNDHPGHLSEEGSRVRTFALWHDRPIPAAAMAFWLNALAHYRGPALLRMKGLFNVDGDPVIAEMVQDVVHEPRDLPRWPTEDRRTRVVFITYDLSEADIAATFDAFDYRERTDAQRPAGRPFEAADYSKFVSAVHSFAPADKG